MGKKSEKVDAAKAKTKAAKETKDLKPVAKVIPKVVEPIKPAPAKKEKPAAPLPAKKEVIASPKAKAQVVPKPVAPTADEIRVEAYHIAEKRVSQGLPGDEASDWVQAEKQLRATRGL